MVDIVDTPSSFVAVDRVETTDIALGGNEINVPNKQFKQCAQRDRWLKDQVDAFIAALGGGLSSPIPGSIKLFGGSGGQGNYNLTSGSDTFADGLYYYNNFNVSAGATLNISQFARIFCLGNVTIAGSIVVSTFSTGGLGFATTNQTNIGGLPGSGPGAGAGSNFPSAPYSYAAAPYGSGGAGGIFNGTGVGQIANGGLGGGGLWFEAAGTITVNSGASITAIGGNGGAGSVTTAPVVLSGGGAGSGGLILLSSLVSVSVAGTLNVRGGNGGNAVGSTGGAGGGGGGGGQVVLIAPTTSTAGSTIILTAGSFGTSLPPTNLGGGCGGSFGGTGGNGGVTAATIGRLITRNFRAVG